MKAVEIPFGFEANDEGFKTPFATAIYLSPETSVTGNVAIISEAEELLGGATPTLIVPDGNERKGVASLKAKLSNVKLPST